MKKTIIPMLLALLLIGCSQDDSQKYASSPSSSSSQTTNASKSDPNQKMDPARQDKSTDSSSVAAAPTPTPSASTPAASDQKPSTDASAAATPSAPTSSAIASTPETKSPTDSTAANTPSATPSIATPSIPAPATSATASAGTDASKAANTSSAIALALRVSEWRLSPDDIRDEFDKTGRIERTKPPAPGAPTGPMDSGVIMNVVKNKLASDSSLAPLNLNIEAKDGTVTLTGTAHNLDQIGHAVACALDSDGVNNAVSLIKLDSKQQ